MLVEHLDLGRSLPQAVAAPRASQRNGTMTSAEQALLATEAAPQQAKGHTCTSVAELGALTGVALLPGGTFTAVTEPTRRGGGSAGVLRVSGR